MTERGDFWRLEQLSDRELLENLGCLLGAQQRGLAEIVAHLGEVEERRLHLQAAHASLFDYCVSRLHMSEDEACRRIELARLARRFPGLFPLIASGELTLSVALLLKPVLTQANHGELIVAVRGKTIRQAREILATLFPSPDLPSSVRKLPERRVAEAPLAANATPLPTRAPVREEPALPTMPSSAASSEPGPSPQPHLVLTPPAARSRIDPIAAQRYKVQFTADASTKEKLELARDLLRHAHPDGELGPIVSRALDLLIADLQRTRFGVGARPKLTRQRPASSAASGSNRSTVSRATRRDVLQRDGLACTWVDESGKRCDSRAWLELDHRHPQGRGGDSATDNIRLLCRAHNQLAAELAYGREHMALARQAHRKPARRTRTPPINTDSFAG